MNTQKMSQENPGKIKVIATKYFFLQFLSLNIYIS